MKRTSWKQDLRQLKRLFFFGRGGPRGCKSHLCKNPVTFSEKSLSSSESLGKGVTTRVPRFFCFFVFFFLNTVVSSVTKRIEFSLKTLKEKTELWPCDRLKPVAFEAIRSELVCPGAWSRRPPGLAEPPCRSDGWSATWCCRCSGPSAASPPEETAEPCRSRGKTPASVNLHTGAKSRTMLPWELATSLGANM